MEQLLKDMIRNASGYHPNVNLKNKTYEQLLCWVHPIERIDFEIRYEKFNT